MSYNRTNEESAWRLLSRRSANSRELADREAVQNSARQPLHSVNSSETHSTGRKNLVPGPRASRKQEQREKIKASYLYTMRGTQKKHSLSTLPWITWMITLITCGIWCITAYQVALDAGAHTLREIATNVLSNAQDVNVLLAFGAKEDGTIIAGQYWRLITPIFLHASLLHVGLNMLTFVILGVMVERLFGHSRFLLLYLLTGVMGSIASFTFAPQEISVGASGAIFGLVGAGSSFIVVHRQAFRYGGIIQLGWLILVIGLILGIDSVIPNLDNYAHIGGLVSGFLLGWVFTPFYISQTPDRVASMVDVRSLKYRWPLALCAIVMTFLLASIAIHFVGG